MKISIYNVKDEPIGCGGMGQVYLGTDPNGNMVAIKEMLAQYVTDADLRARFHQEIHILNKLEHQSIVKMYASFEENGNLYLVMEYVEGETIEQYIKRRGAIDENEAIRLLSEVLLALGYAHQKGYVHRDIKPSNIMIRNNGNVCLLDFGIAKDLNRKNGGLTVGQLTIGTSGYMSPEQAEGYNIDQRSDIYSLGCVLFYMLTGHHAITKQANDYETRMTIIQSSFPKAQDYNPQISNNIQRILDKATDKSMLMRFQSCREFEMEMNNGATIIVDSNNKNTISIGREGCDIIISHPKVSRHHLDIEKESVPTGILYKIKDRSANGTFVDGGKVHNREKTWLFSGSNTSSPSILLAGEVELNWEKIEKVFGSKESSQGLGKKTVVKDMILTPLPTPQPIHSQGESATGWLIAIYVFAILGGLLGLAFGITVYRSKISLPDGEKVYKYKDSHRTAALIGAVLSCVSIFIWKMVSI